MSLSLETIREKSRIMTEPFIQSQGVDIFESLAERYRSIGLATRVLPLKEGSADHLQQQYVRYKKKPLNITADQMEAIFHLGAGMESVEIGELTETRYFTDFTLPAKPSSGKYPLSLIAAFGQALPVPGQPEMPAPERPHIWYYYGFDEAGTAYHLAFQD